MIRGYNPGHTCISLGPPPCTLSMLVPVAGLQSTLRGGRGQGRLCLLSVGSGQGMVLYYVRKWWPKHFGWDCSFSHLYTKQHLPQTFWRSLKMMIVFYVTGKRSKLLSQPFSQHAELSEFLQAHDHLSWLHHLQVNDYSKVTSSLSPQAWHSIYVPDQILL